MTSMKSDLTPCDLFLCIWTKEEICQLNTKTCDELEQGTGLGCAALDLASSVPVCGCHFAEMRAECRGLSSNMTLHISVWDVKWFEICRNIAIT
jgi:hypothetical protein